MAHNKSATTCFSSENLVMHLASKLWLW